MFKFDEYERSKFALKFGELNLSTKRQAEVSRDDFESCAEILSQG